MGERFNLFPEFLAGPYALLLSVRSEIGDLGVVYCSVEPGAISLSPIVRTLAEAKKGSGSFFGTLSADD